MADGCVVVTADPLGEFPSEQHVTVWEAQAHTTRQVMNLPARSVASGTTAEGRAAMAALTAVLAADIGQEAADLAVTYWLIVDRPISDVAWWQYLAPGTPVRHRRDSRQGVVQAADPDGLAERMNGDYLQRWVTWAGSEEPELTRSVDLARVLESTPTHGPAD